MVSSVSELVISVERGREGERENANESKSERGEGLSPGRGSQLQ